MSYQFSKTIEMPFDAAGDPVSSMTAIQNPSLGEIAGEVRGMLAEVVDRL